LTWVLSFKTKKQNYKKANFDIDSFKAKFLWTQFHKVYYYFQKIKNIIKLNWVIVLFLKITLSFISIFLLYFYEMAFVIFFYIHLLFLTAIKPVNFCVTRILLIPETAKKFLSRFSHNAIIMPFLFSLQFPHPQLNFFLSLQ
jgi:hypothetical protein